MHSYTMLYQPAFRIPDQLGQMNTPPIHNQTKIPLFFSFISLFRVFSKCIFSCLQLYYWWWCVISLKSFDPIDLIIRILSVKVEVMIVGWKSGFLLVLFHFNTLVWLYKPFKTLKDQKI